MVVDFTVANHDLLCDFSSKNYDNYKSEIHCWTLALHADIINWYIFAKSYMYQKLKYFHFSCMYVSEHGHALAIYIYMCG